MVSVVTDPLLSQTVGTVATVATVGTVATVATVGTVTTVTSGGAGRTCGYCFVVIVSLLVSKRNSSVHGMSQLFEL